MEKVLHASKVGFPCLRNLWYSVNGYQGAVSAQSQRIFDVGTALEPVIVEWLKSEGWEVEYNPGSQSAALMVTIPVTGGILAGHPDCIISKGSDREILADIKTMNERSYDYWRRYGTLTSKKAYVDQLHVYAIGLQAQGRNIKKLGLVGVNKNTSDMYVDLFDFNPDIAKSVIDRAELVLNAQAPIGYDCPKENWACNYCEFASQCELNKARSTTGPKRSKLVEQMLKNWNQQKAEVKQ